MPIQWNQFHGHVSHSRLTEDEIPEEIEDDDESLSESDGGDVDDNEGDDEGGDGSFTATTEYQSAEEGLELTSMVDNEHENNDTSCGEGVAEYASMDSMTSGAPVLGLPTVTADAVKTDCGCTHCTKARFDQVRLSSCINMLFYFISSYGSL